MKSMTAMVAIAALGAGLAASAGTYAQAATRVQKSFGPWQVDCTETDKVKRCRMMFGLVNQRKQVVFSWSVLPGTDGGTAKSVILTPTGTALASGVAVQFPGAEPLTIPYRTCGPRHCFAEVDLSDRWLSALTSNPTMTVRYESIRGLPTEHQVALGEFKAAYDYYSAESGVSR